MAAGDPSSIRTPSDGSSKPNGGRCPVCRWKVVVVEGAQVLVRNAIVRADGVTGDVTAKCPRCKSWLAVPLRYTG